MEEVNMWWKRVRISSLKCQFSRHKASSLRTLVNWWRVRQHRNRQGYLEDKLIKSSLFGKLHWALRMVWRIPVVSSKQAGHMLGQVIEMHGGSHPAFTGWTINSASKPQPGTYSESCDCGQVYMGRPAIWTIQDEPLPNTASTCIIRSNYRTPASSSLNPDTWTISSGRLLKSDSIQTA